MRECRLYVLEYKFIPQLVERYHKEQVPVEALLDLKFMKEWLLSHHCSDFAFDFNDFTVKYKVIDDNHAMIVYTFPEPYKTPLAKYGAILLHKNHKEKAGYFTIERSDNIYNPGKVNWMLGSMSLNVHANFGYVNECKTEDEFVSLIKKKFVRHTFKDWLKSIFKKKQIKS